MKLEKQILLAFFVGKAMKKTDLNIKLTEEVGVAPQYKEVRSRRITCKY